MLRYYKIDSSGFVKPANLADKGAPGITPLPVHKSSVRLIGQ